MNYVANGTSLTASPMKMSSFVGDGWFETHSGTGSQVSIGNHSPKPQSVHRFVVDLEESTGPNSQVSSQASEVDCTYIAPSKEVESVFITRGYMYVAPPSSGFDSISVNKANKDEQTLKEHRSPRVERGESVTRTEICETQFDSSGAPTTAILDTPSSAESTPVRQVSIEHITADNGQPHALPYKKTPEQPKTDKSQEKEMGAVNPNSIQSCHTTSEPDETYQQLSVASRRLAFEKRAQLSKESYQNNSTSNSAKNPPAIPKRVSSISLLENGPSGENKNAVDLAVASSGTLHEETEAEVAMPPPPPMSTHPGIATKPVIEKGDKQQVEENDEPVKKETFEVEIEFQDANKHRLILEETQFSSLPIDKPEVSRVEHRDKSTEPTFDVKPAPVVPLSTDTISSTDVTQDSTDGVIDNEDVEVKSGKAKIDAAASTSTFGHSTKPSLQPAATICSRHSAEEEEAILGDVDPGKKIGAEVSTFKPVPKPRRLSTVIESGAQLSPVLKDKAPPRPPKISTIPTPRSPPPPATTRTPEMKRTSAYFPAHERREYLWRAQSMSVLPTTHTASPRMMARGEQKQQMPPGFIVFSRSQEAVVSHNATLASNMMRRSIQVDTAENKKGDGKKTSSRNAAPMNTKRGPSEKAKKRRSLFKRK